MNRAALLTLLALGLSCGAWACVESPLGRACQPGDDASCGAGYQCLTYCGAAAQSESICAPSLGRPAGDTFDNEALVDSRSSFGELANVRHMSRSLTLDIADVQGLNH